MAVTAAVDRLENSPALDRAAAPLSALFGRLLASQRVKDVLHGVWFGHPLHPALVDVPIGAWTAASVLDLTAGDAPGATVLVAVGLAAAAPAALAGWADWLDLHEQQQRVGVVHAGLNVLGIGCYATSLAHRLAGHQRRGRLFGLLGFAVLSAGGYLGGHLAFRQAAGANHTEDVPHLMPSGWVEIGRASELPDGEPTQRMAGSVPLFVLRRGHQIWVLADTCSHLSAPLHEGDLVDEPEPCVVCPWHGSTFRLFDGAVVHGPATAPVPALQTRVADDRLLVLLEGAG